MPVAAESPAVAVARVDSPSAASHTAGAMRRRWISIVLAAIVALAGLTVGPCPDGRCAMSAATSKACCKRDGLTKPSCCPPLEIAPLQAVSSAIERTTSMLSHAAMQPAVWARPATVVSSVAAGIADPGTGPPGTLVRQHTSLLI